jgi:hypothetical protein
VRAVPISLVAARMVYELVQGCISTATTITKFSLDGHPNAAVLWLEDTVTKDRRFVVGMQCWQANLMRTHNNLVPYDCLSRCCNVSFDTFAEFCQHNTCFADKPRTAIGISEVGPADTGLVQSQG